MSYNSIVNVYKIAGVKVNPSWLGLSKQSFKRYSNIQGLQLLF